MSPNGTILAGTPLGRTATRALSNKASKNNDIANHETRDRSSTGFRGAVRFGANEMASVVPLLQLLTFSGEQRQWMRCPDLNGRQVAGRDFGYATRLGSCVAGSGRVVGVLQTNTCVPFCSLCQLSRIEFGTRGVASKGDVDLQSRLCQWKRRVSWSD